MNHLLLWAAFVGMLVLFVACRKPASAVSTSGDSPALANRIDESTPFMEHPSDKDETVVEAMADAVARLRQLRERHHWITFMAQGQGDRLDGYQVAQLKLLGDTIDGGEVELDTDKALRAAALDKTGVEVSRSPEGHIVMHRFTARQVAEFMDALFRGQMGIRPHDGEGDDYAVGAEW